MVVSTLFGETIQFKKPYARQIGSFPTLFWIISLTNNWIMEPSNHLNIETENHRFTIHLQFLTSWWFQIFFIFIPIWGSFPILANIFQMGGSTTNQKMFLLICLRQTILGLATTSGTQLMPGECEKFQPYGATTVTPRWWFEIFHMFHQLNHESIRHVDLLTKFTS